MKLHSGHADKQHSKSDFETWASLHGLTKHDILRCLLNCEKSYCWEGVSSNADSRAFLALSDGLAITKRIHGFLFGKSQVEVNEFNNRLQLIVTPSTQSRRSYSRIIDKQNRFARFRIILRYSDKPRWRAQSSPWILSLFAVLWKSVYWNTANVSRVGSIYGWTTFPKVYLLWSGLRTRVNNQRVA